MTHDTHPGSIPEDRFDSWLDGLVAGTPADAASLNGTDGSLGRAMSGARQLHGLAAGTSPAAAAQRRIEEDLMRSGTLAAPRGTTWIPIEKEARRAPWWSPTSPAIAAALVVALIVALGASFIATQRPAEAPTPAPGFAMASPSAMEPAPISELPIMTGDPSDELRSHFGSYGVIDDDGLTVTRPGEDDLVFPDVIAAMPNGVPGEAMLVRDDDTRFVANLTTGETRFYLPARYERQEREQLAGPYLFVTESGENADWTVWDLRTGESRLLTEIVDLPADQPVMPMQTDPFEPTSSGIVVMRLQTPELDLSPDAVVPTIVIAGSLDRALELDGYQPFSQFRTTPLVSSPDDTKIAWVDTVPEDAIVVADTATGDELARFDLNAISPEASPAGFTTDGDYLVVISHDRVLLLGWTGDEPELRVVVDDLNGPSNALFYAPTDALYYHENESLLRMTIPDGEMTTILDGIPSQAPTRLTEFGEPWIYAQMANGIALIDARTGEVVSHLVDMPDYGAPLNMLSPAISPDGSTVVQWISGSESGYLLSPRFPDGLVLTAPVDPEIIAATNSPDGVSIHYSPSPKGSSVVASTFDGVAIPRFVGRVGPDPEWVPIDDTIDALYWLPMPASEDNESDTRTLPAQEFATPMASPTTSGSCATTPPNGDVPPDQNADLDWLGSGVDNPSLWLMMTWDHGRIETNEVSDGYPVKLAFWRGEGSGEIDVTATGADGTELPASVFEPFQADPIPGIHPIGGTVPQPGCWTFTATDGNDTLTWTVDVRSIDASASNAVMVIEGAPGEARFEGGIRIATLGDDGLTLPIEPGVWVSLPGVTQVSAIWNHLDTLHVFREDGTSVVIDLATGDVLFEVEPFQNWTRDFGRWHFVPTDDTLADWTVTDMTTGGTRLLSEMIDLPGDTGVMPSTPPEIFPGDAQVFHLELGTPEITGWVTTDPAARTFFIAGSLDRVTLLPDYPALRDNVGSPTLVASAGGEMVAYETRAGDSRIVALDVASGRVLGRYSATEVGDNPTLAGFDAEGRIIVTSGDRIMALVPGASETVSVVAQDDSAERFDNPLVHAASDAVYVRDVDRLLRFDLETGVGTEIATDLLPDRFGFTKPGSDWIVLPTRDRVMLLDATTGTVASQVWSPGFGPGPADIERYSGWVDGDGDTYIVLFEPQQANGTITLLSTAFPDGLQIAGPADAELGQVWLSPDGETLYAYTSERLSGPGTIWQTPLGEEPDWQPVVEDVTPLPNPMMFFPEG